MATTVMALTQPLSTSPLDRPSQSTPASHQAPSPAQHSELASKINSLDRHGFLFGQKLAASLSPLLHSVVYQHLGLRWEQIRLDSDDMNLFLRLIRHQRFYGESFSVPFPYPSRSFTLATNDNGV